MARRAVRAAVLTGTLLGGVAIFLALVGIVEALHARMVISGVVSLGHALILFTSAAAGYLSTRSDRGSGAGAILLRGALAGAVTGSMLGALALLGVLVDLRTMFVNASPGLHLLLTFGRPPVAGGVPLLLLAGAATSLLGAGMHLVPAAWRRVFMTGLAAVLMLSLFQDLLQLMLQSPGLHAAIRDVLYTVDGPSAAGALGVFAITSGLQALWAARRTRIQQRIAQLSRAGRRVLWLAAAGLGILALLVVPIAGGPFVAQVLVIVGLYTLMGLGLNLEVGLAGLLDLGFVAFFAIGAYIVGLLTSVGPLGIGQWTFWEAVPVAILAALIAGVVLGVPVLRIRGDYLAIATLGFGEIVRLLVLSDFLRPWLGGSQGVLAIPKPVIAGVELAGPQHLFYVTLLSSALVAFVAWRLQHSRLGRAWMAIREDEDVAEALGINLVSVKLLAYGLGAAFAGVAGAIFAGMVGSVFPHSFQLLISINVLSLIIVGGIGSTPGVIVGALALAGLPELLREFGEFRFLIYGAALVAMMLLRPEGLWPAAAVKRELREAEPDVRPAAAAAEPGDSSVASHEHARGVMG